MAGRPGLVLILLRPGHCCPGRQIAAEHPVAGFARHNHVNAVAGLLFHVVGILPPGDLVFEVVPLGSRAAISASSAAISARLSMKILTVGASMMVMAIMTTARASIRPENALAGTGSWFSPAPRRPADSAWWPAAGRTGRQPALPAAPLALPRLRRAGFAAGAFRARRRLCASAAGSCRCCRRRNPRG